MNLVEAARKAAKWPDMHRDVPQFGKPNGDKKSWSITQDELASFVGAVGSLSSDLMTRIESLNSANAKLANEKANLAAENARLTAKLAAYETARLVKQEAESMDLKPAQVNRLEQVVKVS